MKERYLLLGLVILFMQQPVSAYLDPGTGSLIWQMAIGILLGATFMLNKYWQEIKVRFKSTKNE